MYNFVFLHTSHTSHLTLKNNHNSNHSNREQFLVLSFLLLINPKILDKKHPNRDKFNKGKTKLKIEGKERGEIDRIQILTPKVKKGQKTEKLFKSNSLAKPEINLDSYKNKKSFYMKLRH